MKILSFPIKPSSNENGAAMLEYALAAALIAIVSIAALGALGTEASYTFNTAGQAIADANGIQPGNSGL